MMSDTDSRQVQTSEKMADSVSRQAQTAERGAWLNAPMATAFLGVTERTLHRRAARGEVQRRSLSGGRTEFWIPDATSQDLSADTVRQGDPEHDAIEFALSERINIPLLERVNQLATEQTAPLIRMIAEQAEEIGRLREQLAAASTVSAVSADPVRQPWWRRWFGP